MLTDNLGSVRDLVDNVGALVANGHFTYDAYGQVLSGDTMLIRYLYTGREFERFTNLQYNRERWYDAETGRWISNDPLSFAAGDSNLSRYVGNSPTNATDPSGELLNFLVQGAIGAVVGSVIGGGLAWYNNQSVWAGAAAGAVGGAVAGATFGLGTAALGTGWAATAGVGAASGGLGGASSSALGQGLENGFRNIDLSRVGMDGAEGAVAGAVLAPAAKLAGAGIARIRNGARNGDSWVREPSPQTKSIPTNYDPYYDPDSIFYKTKEFPRRGRPPAGNTPTEPMGSSWIF